MDWSSCLDKVTGDPTLRCAPIIFYNVINSLIILSGVVALLFIIYGGFKYIQSGGDPTQLDKARKTLMFAVIGLVLVFSAYFVLHFLSGITGVNCINTIGPTTCQ